MKKLLQCQEKYFYKIIVDFYKMQNYYLGRTSNKAFNSEHNIVRFGGGETDENPV